MSTLTEIEQAVAALSACEQRQLLQRLSAKLQAPARSAGAGRRSRWLVPPPKVSKVESRRVAQRIEEEFGRVEWESWK